MFGPSPHEFDYPKASRHEAKARKALFAAIQRGKLVDIVKAHAKYHYTPEMINARYGDISKPGGLTRSFYNHVNPSLTPLNYLADTIFSWNKPKDEYLKKRIEIATTLLSMGANANIEDCYGWIPATHAYSSETDTEFQRLLMEQTNWDKLGETIRMDGKPHLFKLVIDGHFSEEKFRNGLNLYIETGGNINITDRDGNTAIHYISGKNPDLQVYTKMKILLEFGLDPALTNQNGVTAGQIYDTLEQHFTTNQGQEPEEKKTTEKPKQVSANPHHYPRNYRNV